MLTQNFILQIVHMTHVEHSYIPPLIFRTKFASETLTLLRTHTYAYVHMYVYVRIVGNRQQREWNIRVSTFVLLHRVRGGTGCRISIDLLTELEPVAESSGRKGEEGLARR